MEIRKAGGQDLKETRRWSQVFNWPPSARPVGRGSGGNGPTAVQRPWRSCRFYSQEAKNDALRADPGGGPGEARRASEGGSPTRQRGKIPVANGNHALPGRSHRVGVTSDGAENAPRLRVTYGEDSQESVPPLKHRVETHTASAQSNSAPVPWRWRSRGARIRSHSAGDFIDPKPGVPTRCSTSAKARQTPLACFRCSTPPTEQLRYHDGEELGTLYNIPVIHAVLDRE